MPSEMVGSVTTGIDLNETKAVESINRLKSAVKDSTREWQINEAQAKSAGDAVGASKTRYEGLSEAIEKQKSYIANLSEGMKSLNRNTEAGERAYQKYNGWLTTAERSLASMTGQLNRAKAAYEYQLTGIGELNKALEANDKLMKSQISLHEQTNNKLGAAKAAVSGLNTSYEKQTEIYKAQVSELKRLESAQGTSNEALVKQRTRVNEAGVALSGYRTKLNEARVSLAEIKPFGTSGSALTSSLNTVYSATEKTTNAMSKGFEKVKSGATTAAIGLGVLSIAAVKGAEKASELQNSYVKTYNLAVTGGEKVAEATKNVAQMQKDGAKYSVEYGKSQEEIAEGYKELIKRGYTSAEALGAMKSELQASVASGEDFNSVLSVTSQVVDAYGKRTDNAAKMTKNTKDVVNQLTYAADMTATDFPSMGKAMEYVGDTAYSAGIKLSEASSAIGILSNHGLEADKAGTGLRKVINSITAALSSQDASQQNATKSIATYNEQIAEHQKKLEAAQAVVNSGTKNTKAATKAIETQKSAITKLEDKVQQLQSGGASDMLSKLGIKKSDLVDANGNLRDLTTIMAVIDEHTKNMGSAEKNSVFQQLFGTTGQQAGIILAHNNEELEKLNQKVKKSADGQGYVAELAKKNMGTVKAELAQFEQAGEAVLIMIGQKMLPVMSEAATSMVKAFNSKEGQAGLQAISDGIGTVMDDSVKFVEYLGTHRKEVEVFGATLAGIWGVKKAGDLLITVQKISGALGAIKTKSLFKDSGALSLGSSIESGGKVAGTTIASSMEGAGTIVAEKIAASMEGASFVTKENPLGNNIGNVTSTTEKEVQAIENTASTVGKGRAVAGEVEEVAATTSKFGKITGALGKFAAGATKLLGIAGLIAQVGSSVYSEATSKKESTHTKTVGIGGTLSGAAGGAAIGAGVGSVVPVIGTGVGALIGASIGAAIGSPVAKSIQKALTPDKYATESYSKAGKIKTSEDKTYSKSYGNFIDNINKASNADVSNSKDLKKAEDQTNKAYANMGKSVDKFYKDSQKSSKGYLETLVKNGVMTQKQADDILKNEQKNDEKSKKSQKNTLKDMQKLQNNYYSAVSKEDNKYSKQQETAAQYHAKQIAKIKAEYGGKGQEKQLNAALSQEDKRYRKEEESNANAHYKNLSKLKSSYVSDMQKQEDKMNEKVTVATKIAQNKQLDLLTDVKNKKGTLNTKELRETIEKAQDERDAVVNKAKSQRDEVVKEANKKYKETVAAADKERATNSNFSKAQYDEVVKNAKKQKDDSISAANDQQKKTTKSAEDTYKDTTKFASDKADANIKSAAYEHKQTVSEYAQGLTDTRDGINTFVDAINGVLNFLHKGWGKIPRMGAHAKGTKGLSQDEVALVGEEGFELAHHPQKGIYAVGADGPEIKHLKAGTSILPHEMSKEFLAMTANLPAHANGVEGFLSDAYKSVKSTVSGGINWAEKEFKDVESLVSKGASSAINEVYKTIGLDGISDNYSIEKMALGTGENAKDNFIKYAEGFFKKAKSDAGGSKGSPSGSGVQRWAGQVKQALAANGLSTSQDMIDRVLRQIATESSGNEKAVQGAIGDINNITGDLAKGLMQTISATFNAYKFPGHGDIFNGYDNLLAALNYAKSRYGPSLSFLGNGHGYENGGIISSHGLYEIAEGNRPEMVIPLSAEKNSRANQLLLEANQRINGKNGNLQTASDSDIRLTQAVNLLSQMLGATKEQTTALKNQPVPIIDENSLFKGAASTISKTQTAYQNTSNRRRGMIN